jgi:hypothetical protein
MWVTPVLRRCFGGAETGRPHMNIDSNVNINGPTCKIVQFAKTFVSTPVVVGSIDDASAEKGAAWIENVNKNQFRYCYRESGAQASGVGTAGGNSAGTQTDADGNPSSHDDVYFNFVAFVHKNPDAWYAANALPYLEANNAAIAHHGCTTVNFARTHSIAPKVFVTANHQDDATVDWNAAPRDAVSTWVTSVTTTGFEVCSSELAIHAAGNEDDNLQAPAVLSTSPWRKVGHFAPALGVRQRCGSDTSRGGLSSFSDNLAICILLAVSSGFFLC